MEVYAQGVGEYPKHNWALIKDDDSEKKGFYWYAKWYPGNLHGLPKTLNEGLEDAKQMEKNKVSAE